MIADMCGAGFHGIGGHNAGSISLHMYHGRSRCGLRPQSAPDYEVKRESAQRVLGCVSPDEGWCFAVPGRSISQQILASRREQHRVNMTLTVQGIKRLAETGV
jgi:hypothetical protein